MPDEQSSTKAFIRITLGPPTEQMTLLGKPLAGDHVELDEDSKLIIGRNPNVANFIAYDMSEFASVSRLHCSIEYDDDFEGFMITDEASTNGTFIGENRVPPHEPTLLTDGDVVTLGSIDKKGLQFIFTTSEKTGKQRKRRIVVRPLKRPIGTQPVPLEIRKDYVSTKKLLDEDEGIPTDPIPPSQSIHTLPIQQYDVFVSYSHDNIDIMRHVRDTLRDDYELAVWTDENLKPGTELWQTAVEVIIETTLCVLVLMSPEAKKSEWVQRELSYAHTHERIIFPALIDGDDQNAVPFSVSGAQYVDMRDDKFDTGLTKLANNIREKVKELKAQS